MTIRSHVGLAALLIVAGVPQAASALQVSYSNGVSTPTQPDWNTVLSLRQFDPALGKLTAIDFTLYATIDGIQFDENLQNIPLSGYHYNSARVLLRLADMLTMQMQPMWIGNGPAMAAFDGIIDFSGPSSGSGSGHSADTFPVPIISFTGWSGTGLLHPTIDVTSLLPQGYRYYSNVVQYESDLVTAGASVTYTYDAPDVVPPAGSVPEPASWAMLILGFGLIGAAARRRRSGLAICAA